MKNYKVIKGINVVLVCVVVLTAIYTIYPFLNRDKQTVKLSEIQIEDIYGNDIDLTNNSNNGTIINFWASWCPACINELPLLNESYRQEKFDLVTINIADNVTGIQKYVKRYDLVMPVVLDSEFVFKNMYAVNALPLTIVINSKGEVIERFQGELSNMDQIKQLKQKLRQINE